MSSSQLEGRTISFSSPSSTVQCSAGGGGLCGGGPSAVRPWLVGATGPLIVGTALHCTTLHCTALHCTALHCTAGLRAGLPPSVCSTRAGGSRRWRSRGTSTALHCTALHCTKVALPRDQREEAVWPTNQVALSTRMSPLSLTSKYHTFLEEMVLMRRNNRKSKKNPQKLCRKSRNLSISLLPIRDYA
jgi:hypothetical protein